MWLFQLRDGEYMGLLLQQGQHLLQHPRGNLPAAERDSTAAFCGHSVTLLDLRPLAGAARGLVASSGVGKRPNTHQANLRKLWVFHCWLLQHQLLDGRGLTGLLTEEQLQRGQEAAAEFGDGMSHVDNC